MIIFNALLICLLIVLTSFYISLVIVTLVKSEDFGERVSIKVSLILPLLILLISLNAAIKSYKEDKKKIIPSLKMGTINYPIAAVMLFAMIHDHQAQVELFGESIYSRNKYKEVEVQKVDRRKSWLESLANIKAFVFSEIFINDLKKSLKMA